tara:strand:+ start:1261 stop:2379 length:1119 start_codon:yes stop_codon:yes gene_type:complete
VKITESSLKRIIREELERLAEAPEPKTLWDYFKSIGEKMPRKSVRQLLARQRGIPEEVWRKIGTAGPAGASANTVLLKALLKDPINPNKEKEPTPSDPAAADKTSAEEAEAGYKGGANKTRAMADEEYAIMIAKAIHIMYGEHIGSLIDAATKGTYGSIPADAAESVGWARLYPGGKGLGLIHQPSTGDLKTMRRSGLKLPKGTNNQHAAAMLKSAFGIASGVKPISATEFGNQIFSALVGIDKSALDTALPNAITQLAGVGRKYPKSKRKRDKAVNTLVSAQTALTMFAPEKGEVTFQGIKDNIAKLYKHGGDGSGESQDLATTVVKVAKGFISQSNIINGMINDRPNVKKRLHISGAHPSTPEAVNAYLS